MTAASYRTSNGDLVAAVVVLNSNGGVLSEGGSATAAGTSGSAAQAVQGITNGVPIPVSLSEPLSGAVAGVAGVATTVAANSLIVKAGSGLLYSLYATSTVAGWLMVFNAVTAPADGTVTPIHAIPIAAGGFASIPSIHLPEWYTTGITAVFSTTGPFTKTASATAFIHAGFK